MLAVLAGVVMFATGNELWEGCREAPSTPCSWYVIGAHDGYVAGLRPKRPAYCLPVPAMNVQMQAVVKKYLEDHPERRHMLASDLVVEAFTVAFPCREAP